MRASSSAISISAVPSPRATLCIVDPESDEFAAVTPRPPVHATEDLAVLAGEDGQIRFGGKVRDVRRGGADPVVDPLEIGRVGIRFDP